MCRYGVKKLRPEFIKEFEHYLRAQKNIGINSVAKYLKNLKKVIGECVEKSCLDKNPFDSFKVKHQQVSWEFLLEEEIKTC